MFQQVRSIQCTLQTWHQKAWQHLSIPVRNFYQKVYFLMSEKVLVKIFKALFSFSFTSSSFSLKLTKLIDLNVKIIAGTRFRRVMTTCNYCSLLNNPNVKMNFSAASFGSWKVLLSFIFEQINIPTHVTYYRGRNCSCNTFCGSITIRKIFVRKQRNWRVDLYVFKNVYRGIIVCNTFSFRGNE